MRYNPRRTNTVNLSSNVTLGDVQEGNNDSEFADAVSQSILSFSSRHNSLN